MSLLNLAKEKVSSVLQAGDLAVDATMGNGWDTLFLAEQVGAAGQVYAFDVQEAAFAATEKRLRRAGLLERCQLFQLGHEAMAEPLGKAGRPVAAVMFNLGYLPYAAREVITREETTLLALEAAISLLQPGGIVTVVCYRGHSGGEEEAKAVWDWTRLQESDFDVEIPREWPSGVEPVLLSVVKKED